jgi:hypothetical protein
MVDTTPPAVTESADPTDIPYGKKNDLVDVSYTGTADDTMSGVISTMTLLIDEYGQLDHDLSPISGFAIVEAWCRHSDSDGRTYIIRLTARDEAGHEATAEVIVSVTEQ